MRVDELVDGGLIGGVDFVELQAHAVAAIAPRDAPLGIDVLLRARQPEAQSHLGAVFEWAGGPDGDAAQAQVQRQCRRDGIAEAIRDGDSEHHARAAAAVEVIGKQMRRQRRQDVLHGAVFVHVTGDAERRQIAHFFGVGDRAAENEDRQALPIELADAAHEVDTRGVGQAQIDHEQVQLGQIGAHAPEQLHGALDGHRAVPGGLQRCFETVSDERGVVGDEDGLGARRRSAHKSIVIPSNVSED